MKQKQSMSFFTLLSMICSVMIGAGILVLPSEMARFGMYGFWAWPLASIMVLNLAIIFAKVIKIPGVSDPASIAGATFGQGVGFVMSWSHWFGLIMGTSLITIALTSYTMALFAIPSHFAFIIAISYVWLMLLLQSYFTFASMKMMMTLTVLKIGALALIILAGLPYFKLSIMTVQPTLGAPTGWQGLLGALSLAMFAFVGIESATLPAQEGGDDRTIALATIAGAVITATLYVLSYSVVVSVLSAAELRATHTPMSDAAFFLLGAFGRKLIAGLALIGCAGSLQGCLLGCSYLVKNSSRIQCVPKQFNSTTSVGTPLFGGLITAVAISVMLCLFYIMPASAHAVIKNYLANMEVFLIALVYLSNVFAYHTVGGNMFVTLIGILSCILFLIGTMTGVMLIVLQLVAFSTGIGFYYSLSCKK